MAASPYVVGASVVGPIAFLIVLGLSIWIKRTVGSNTDPATDTIPNIKLGLVIAIVVGYIIAHSIFVGYTFTISQLSGSQKTIEAGCDENPMEKETVRYKLSHFLNASGPYVFSFGLMFYFVLLAAMAFGIITIGGEYADNTIYLVIIAICLVLLFIDGITAVSVGGVAKPLMTGYDGMFAGQLNDIFNQMRTNDKTDINKMPSNLAKIITHRVLSENPGLNTVDGVQRLLNSGETANHIPLKDYLSFHASSKDVSQLFAGNVVGNWASHKNIDAGQWDNIQRRMKADTVLHKELYNRGDPPWNMLKQVVQAYKTSTQTALPADMQALITLMTAPIIAAATEAVKSALVALNRAQTDALAGNAHCVGNYQPIYDTECEGILTADAGYKAAHALLTGKETLQRGAVASTAQLYTYLNTGRGAAPTVVWSNECVTILQNNSKFLELYFDSLLGRPAQREKLLKYITFNVNIPAMDIQRVGDVSNVYSQMNTIVNPLIFASWVGLAAIAYLIFHPLYKAGYGAAMIMSVFAVIMITMVFFWIAISFAA